MGSVDAVTTTMLVADEALLDAVRGALRESYGITAHEIATLGGEIDLNLGVVDAEGRRLVVKVSPSWSSEEVIDWQERLLDHVATRSLSFAVPTMVRARDGAGHVSVPVGGDHVLVRVLSWVPGEVYAAVPGAVGLGGRLGRVAAELTLALEGAAPPPSGADHHWLVVHSDEAVRETVGAVRDPARRAQVETIMRWFAAVRRVLAGLPVATVHQDLNDFNVLLGRSDGRLDITGVVDFGDARPTVRVAELAVAVAYNMLRRQDPLGSACEVISGYHQVLPLSDDELSVVFPLAAARLCVNATTWTDRAESGNGVYGSARTADTWPAIAAIATIHPLLAERRIRRACGLAPRRHDSRAQDSTRGRVASVLPQGIPIEAIDLTPRSALFDEIDLDAGAVRRRLAVELSAGEGDRIRVASAYSPLLPRAALRDVGAAEPATIQLGTGLITARPQTLRAPTDCRISRVPSDGRPGVLEHITDAGAVVHSLWWGVQFERVAGAELTAGEPFAVLPAFGDGAVGGLFSGVVQLVTDARLIEVEPPLVVRPSEVALWREVCPDPAVLLTLPDQDAEAPWEIGRVLDTRRRRLAPSQRNYFERPMNLVRGRGVWLYDENAMKYLDPINNVSHVGHANARVAEAGARQMRTLNTNSRLVYPGIAEYAERLTATLPPGLDVVFFVCTGSEANDLALRIARQVTGREHVMVIDSAYHGNTTAVMDVSPNRYKAAGGGGTPPKTREVMTPDRYRGPYGYDDAAAGTKYAENVRDVVNTMVVEGTPPAAFIAESLIGTGGNYILPPGYLRESYAAVRAAGALCIADEVQIGFGRLGARFWGFETHDVVPDIVTMGKPMGNGHPLAAVVTTRAIAERFDNGVKYFNTFGGNPVSCAIGMSVLDVIGENQLQERASVVGEYFRLRLEELTHSHPLIGDVRGQGLYLGVEIVTDRETKEPGAAEALQISEMLKDRGVIMYPNGRYDNVLKIKPPMVFTEDDVDLFVSRLDRVLSELGGARGEG